MTSGLISQETLRKKKFAILCCGVIMYFFTNMSKVLIPGTIFNELLQTGLDVKSISALGAVYMYSYAASQILAGVFADRYGGVRILLIGGSMFTAGTIGFPFAEHLWLMYLFRILTGFGAGTVFLGVAKLLADLFPAKFAMAMGVILVLGYIGPTAGTMIVFLIKAVGWQWAMAIPGIIAVAALLGVSGMMKGTIVPVTGGQSFLPLLTIVKRGKMWLLWLTSSVIFGSYYVLLAQIGQKSITDFGGISAEKAATCIMIMTIMVALNNMGVNGIVKLCGNRRKIAAAGASAALLQEALRAGSPFRTDGASAACLRHSFSLPFPQDFSLCTVSLPKSWFLRSTLDFQWRSSTLWHLFLSLCSRIFQAGSCRDSRRSTACFPLKPTPGYSFSSPLLRYPG